MTFRAKPVAKRTQKHSWESRDRKNFYLNLGFGLVVVSAIAILLIAVVTTYYNDNLAPVGSVNGQTITKGDLRDRAQIESWRLNHATQRIRTLAVAGRLSQAQADSQTQAIASQQQQIVPISLERLIDNRLQATLADEQGVTVSDADIDARLVEEATTPAARHAWVIEVAPELDAGATAATPAQVAAARAKADAALADLGAGKAWEDIAKTVSTDASTAAQGGDLGWVQEDDSQIDPALLAALWTAEMDKPTAVLQGDDGAFRIGRVTEIADASVDPAYTDAIVNDGIDLGKYRTVVRGDVVRKKLEDAVVADALKPGPQRDTSEIFVSADTLALPESAVRVRHILFSPEDDPAGAQAGNYPDDDPAWGQAKLDAEAALAKLKADPSQFDAVAREGSDEAAALGPNGSGGLLDAYVSTDSGYVPSFSEPIITANAVDGEILPLIKTEFGYHIVQVLHHRPTMDGLKARLADGADFATLARDFSEGAEASTGGRLGWIARGQLDPKRSDAVFAAPIGTPSDVLAVPDDGSYIFLVDREEERTPNPTQADQIRSSAWSAWYDPKKAAATITRDEAITGSSATQ